MIDGITIKNDQQNVAICTIREFSAEFQEILRSELVSITRGANSKYTDYITTLKDFTDRYISGKSTEWKKGGIGELLTHLLLHRIFENLETISCLFNLEDRGFKKGFDVVYHQVENSELWYTEIKSGGIGENQDSTTTSLQHLEKAQKDIYTKFRKNKHQIWDNAKNHAYMACQFEQLDQILKQLQCDSSRIGHENRNIILVSVLFSNISDSIKYEEIIKKYQEIKDVNNLILLCIHKNTYQRICDFMVEEIEKSCPS